jgi:hypothetical protein
MVFKATFNNISCISWRSVLLAEETGVPRENHWPAACHWQTLSHNVVSSTPRHEQGSNSTSVMIGPDCTGSCKSNYYTITTTTTTAPYTKYDILSCNHYICCTIKLFLLLLMPNSNCLRQVEDHVRVSTWQLKELKNIDRFYKLVFDRGDSSLECLIEATADLNVW